MSDVSETLCIRAPAKINLSLGVLARREDGFHEIESLMVPVTLADTLRVRRTHGSEVTLSVTFSGALSCESGRTPRRNVPSDQTNLVVRAAELLARKAGVRMGLEIELEKKNSFRSWTRRRFKRRCRDAVGGQSTLGNFMVESTPCRTFGRTRQ